MLTGYETWGWHRSLPNELLLLPQEIHVILLLEAHIFRLLLSVERATVLHRCWNILSVNIGHSEDPVRLPYRSGLLLKWMIIATCLVLLVEVNTELGWPQLWKWCVNRGRCPICPDSLLIQLLLLLMVFLLTLQQELYKISGVQGDFFATLHYSHWLSGI